MNQQHDPYWKILLNWAAVITFFLLPIAALVIHLYALTHPGWLSGPLSGKQDYEFGYIRDLQRDVTFLVFGLAGLRTWENIRNGRINAQPKENKT